MKRGFLLLGLIFAFLLGNVHAQVTETFHQSFEPGETQNYTVISGTVATQSQYAHGTQALKLSHTATAAVVQLDDIDFSTDATWQYFSFEFSHICKVDANNCASPQRVAIFEIKMPNLGDDAWTRLGSAYYATEGGYNHFSTLSSFSSQAYTWSGAINNDSWVSERFNLDNYFRQIAVAQRKLQIRITLVQRTASGNTTEAWYLDDLSVKASPSAMIKPKITMALYPDLVRHPSSRGARIAVDATTSIAGQTMCDDSIYLQYKVGSSPIVHHMTMSPVAGVANRYEARMPFEGYDTLMYWRLVAKDATSNHNWVTFPADTTLTPWMTFYYIRGKSFSGPVTQANLSNNSEFPFPNMADSRSEFIYDSALMAQAGFGPGGITDLQFVVNSSAVLQRRERFQVRMRNKPADYVPGISFTNDYTHVVWDSTMIIQSSGSGVTRSIHLQDTFYYAGKDLIVQMIYDNSTTNPAATSIKHFPTGNVKKSLHKEFDAYYEYNTYTNSQFKTGDQATTRPYFLITEKENLPLLHDCGISTIIRPNYTNPATAGTPQRVEVRLRNYGALPMQNVKVYYQLDNNAPVMVNWTGNLAGGDSTTVLMSTTQQIPVGYHTITAWVDDSLTSGGVRYRDHEPYNDTCITELISCTGPMSGTRQIGPNGDYATVEEFLFAVSSCGMNGPLTVRINGGRYKGFSMPEIDGLSRANYLTFEPIPNTGEVVFIDSALVSGSNCIVNLAGAAHVRFNNIAFYRINNSSITNLVRLGSNSSDCYFTNCTFNDFSNTPINALITNNYADSLQVISSHFIGGFIGVLFEGQASDMRSNRNRAYANVFEAQRTNALKAVNQTNLTIDSNSFADVQSLDHMVLLQNCYGSTRVVRNKMHTNSGAACLGVTDIHGTASNYALIANNMFVCEDQTPSSVEIKTPVNIIGADYAKVVFNSVKINAPEHSNVAAATFGGSGITNSWFVNNIVACYDSSNYALNFIPGSATNNRIDHNLYYSRSEVLNKKSGNTYDNLSQWRTAVPMDSTSRVMMPGFVEDGFVDLRTFNQSVRGWGTPIAEVTTDMFDTVRDATAPCVGAYEFTALYYDFYIEELVSPELEYCAAPSNIEVVARITNGGIANFTPSANQTLSVCYRLNNGTVVTTPVTTPIAAGQTILWHSGHNVQIPSNGYNDGIYTLKLWTVSPIDPNHVNDTTSPYTLVSHYHQTAPTTVNTTSTYNQPATITIPSANIPNWYISAYNRGRQEDATVYWFRDATTNDTLFVGNPYTTGILQTDTTLYISTRKAMPLVKITEVQFNKNKPGATTPMPTYINATNQLVVELTNIGDVEANLSGDTLMTITGETSSAASFTKTWVLPNVTLAPNSSIVCQFKSGTNSATTIFGGSSAQIANNSLYSKKIAIIYRDGGGIADVVAFNDVTSSTNWTNANIPSEMWAGAGIAMTDVAGVSRTGWPTNRSATPSNSASYWRQSSAAQPMHLAEVESNLIRFPNNDCPSDRGIVNVQLLQRPNVDLSIDTVIVPSGCGLVNEPVTVQVRNYGTSPVSNVVLKYAVDGTLTGCDTLTQGIGGNSVITHTFSTLAYMHGNTDLNINVRAWVEAVSGDPNHANDTASAIAHSLYTPPAPAFPTVSINYGTPATVSLTSNPNEVHVWYDRFHRVLDTAASHTTPILYANDTLYASIIGAEIYNSQIGTGTTMNGATAYPSPYNPNKKFVKEQYIYKATDLAAAGYIAGPITALSFYLGNVPAATGTIHYTDYTIKIGATAQTAFTSTKTYLTGLTQVFSSSNFSLSAVNVGWVKHDFQTPFYWDGTSNIVVEVCRSLSAAITAGAQTRYSTSSNTVLTKQDNTSSVCSSATAATLSGNRPHILFDLNFYEGCEGPQQMIPIEVIGVPNTDAAIEWIDGMDTTNFTSCGNSVISVSLQNRGSSTFSNYTLYYKLDNATSYSQTTGTQTIEPNQSHSVTLLNQPLLPGRHIITAYVHVDGDTITNDDTIRTQINVRFCGGTYTLGPNSTANYHSFTEVADSLTNAGIAGPVTFSVAAGTYNEHPEFVAVEGTSDINTITFQSANGNPANVILRNVTTQANPYVVKFNGAEYVTFRNITIYAAPNDIASNANINTVYAYGVMMENTENITIDGCNIRVRPIIKWSGSGNNRTASESTTTAGIVIGPDVDTINILNNTLDSGYYAIFSQNVTTEGQSSHITINGNTLDQFYTYGVKLSKVGNVKIVNNMIRSYGMSNNQKMTGIEIDNTAGAFNIEKNNIQLIDNFTGGRRGIHVSAATCANLKRGKIYNNMVNLKGTGIVTNLPHGIWLENSSYINVYYNTVSVNVGTGGTNTCAFRTESNVSNVFTLNNIFANFSKGSAYFITSVANIASSNYNDYWSTDTNRIFKWANTFLTNIDNLRAANQMDVNSWQLEPYFVSDSDLHLSVGLFAEKALYTTEVPDDIDGTIRPQIPNPSIGAHEYTRLAHDVSVVDILSPTLETENIETDPITVWAKFYNNGTATELNASWYAVFDTNGVIISQSTPRPLGVWPPMEIKEDSVVLTTNLGIIDTQHVTVYITLNGDINPEDNVLTQEFYLDPAFNFSAELVSFGDGDLGADLPNCRRQHTPIAIQVKNVGKKPVPAGQNITIGYRVYQKTGTGNGQTWFPVPNYQNQWVEEVHSLTEQLDVQSGVTIDFNQTANLYPTGIDKDLDVNIRGWVNYVYDKRPANDSTNKNSCTVHSYYTPHSPIGQDITIPYATWDTIWSTQGDTIPIYNAQGTQTNQQYNQRPVRWFRPTMPNDTSNVNNPFYTGNNYNLSRHWNNTPQYFHDSTYYLACVSANECPSYYSPVHVHLLPRREYDVSVQEVLNPSHSKVFLNEDTVTIRIINYGTQPVSNIPVHYQLFTNNGTLLQDVSAVCTATITQDNTYDYKFDTLLHINNPNPNNDVNYKLRVWTDLPNDQTRLNDTNRTYYEFQALKESTYCAPTVESTDGLDIVRVSYNTLNWFIPEIGHDHLNFGHYDNPEAPVLHLSRGFEDTLIVESANNRNSGDYGTAGRATVYIDWDRSGTFELTEMVASDVIYPHNPGRFTVEVPQDAYFGDMIMRVILDPDTTNGISSGCPALTGGQVQDFRIYIDEFPVMNDAALLRINSPATSILKDSVYNFRYVMANRGTQTINSAQICYQFVHPTSDSTYDIYADTIDWTGELHSGRETRMTLPSYTFPLGTTRLDITLNVPGDTLTDNNHLSFEYHRFHTVQPTIEDSFDDLDLSMWYAPGATTDYNYNAYNQNLWQRGAPNKAVLNTTYNGNNAWVTDTINPIVSGIRGNYSVLYSPIVNIRSIKTDTISFMMASQMLTGSRVWMEFYDYQGSWQKVVCDTCTPSTNWYNGDHCFEGNSPNGEYVLYKFPTSKIGGDFPQDLQFRFIYTSDPGANVRQGYGDGVSIDTLRIGRGRITFDVGVTAITGPQNPQFGQIVYPEVTITNFGSEAQDNITLRYTPYGTNMAKVGHYVGHLEPNQSTSFRFDAGFLITNDFPDTFSICANTFNGPDLYWDNDSCCGTFTLSPLDNDLYMMQFVEPQPNIVAGDSITVTVRLRNFGMQPIPRANVTYIFNHSTVITEEIDFQQALGGQGLETYETYNYTFHQRVRSSLGYMSLMAYADYDADGYRYNDTIEMSLTGITAIKDLKAKAITIDTTSLTKITVQLLVENIGSTGANNFTIGFWFNNDPDSTFEQTIFYEYPLPAFSTRVYTFDKTLTPRTDGINEYYITAWVHIDGDNDRSNDTTQLIMPQSIDLEAVKLLVEENREDDCNVRLVVNNVGTYTATKRTTISATINGTTISRVFSVDALALIPGITYELEFDQKIPKSPSRNYAGQGSIRTNLDKNEANDQTSVIEVKNYFEGIPLAGDASLLTLEQNYPNPFTNETRIDFNLPYAGTVRFFVMDVTGRLIYQSSDNYDSGLNSIDFSKTILSSGVYYYGIEFNGERLMRKMILK